MIDEPIKKEQLPKRKRNRLKNYNYNWRSSYFITVCTKDRRSILGSVSKKYISDGNSDSDENCVAVSADVILSKIGKVVQKHIEASRDAYDNIELENYVIMPNHIHLILYVSGADEESTSPCAAIPKYISVLKKYINKECGKNIFQRSYYDHIIRNEKDFDKVWDYVEGNPIMWEKDCLYSEVESAFTFVGDDDPGVP